MTTHRAQYTAQMKHQLDELNAKLDALESKAADAKEEAREKYRTEVAKLRAQSTLAKNKFGELMTSGEDSWDKMVIEMDKIQTAFSRSFQYFKSQV